MWIWQEGAISVHILEGETYRAVPGSRALPDIDLGTLVHLLDADSASAAIKAFRKFLESDG